MIELLPIGPNMIVKDNDTIDLAELNRLIREELLRRKDILPQDKTTRRASRNGNYIVIHAHGTFSQNIMLEYVSRILQSEGIKFIERQPTPEERELLKDQLPQFSIMNEQYQGGPDTISDSRDTIDENIEDLCNAINKMEGIETFASCDGHGGARHFYFLYTAETLRDAERAIYYLRSCVDKYFPRLGINIGKVKVSLNAEYMPDGVPTGIYFAFKILYENSETAKIYEFSRLAAKEILKQLDLGNTGSSSPHYYNGKYYLYNPF